MSRKNESVTVVSLNQEIETWIEQDQESPGAWSMFMLVTLKKLQQDYEITMQYLTQISKEQFDFVCPVIDEIVYSFQKMEMVELIENLYHKFYGASKDTEIYCDSIEGLRNCIKCYN